MIRMLSPPAATVICFPLGPDSVTIRVTATAHGEVDLGIGVSVVGEREHVIWPGRTDEGRGGAAELDVREQPLPRFQASGSR